MAGEAKEATEQVITAVRDAENEERRKTNVCLGISKRLTHVTVESVSLVKRAATRTRLRDDRWHRNEHGIRSTKYVR